MGISIALNEETKFDNKGRLLNPNLTDYKIARVKDIPDEIINEFLGIGQKDAPFGAKGIGELTMLAWPAAIANALREALGIRITELPVTADRLLEIIKKHRPDLIEKLRKSLLG